jgi:hypothetical protein
MIIMVIIIIIIIIIINNSLIAEILTLLLYIQEVPGSNLEPETGYPELFLVFPSHFRQMPGWHLKLGHDRFLPIHYSLFILSLDTV